MRLPFSKPSDLAVAIRSIDHRATGLTRTRWRQVRELTLAITWCGAHDGCRASVDRLIQVANANCEDGGRPPITSLRQFFTVRRAAVELGIVVCEPSYNGDGRTFSERAVDLVRVAELVAASRTQAVRGVQQNRHTPGTISALTQHLPSTHPLLYLNLPNQENLPSSSSSTVLPGSQTRGAVGADGGWEAAEDEIFAAGINQARKAIRGARSAGATPEQVIALVAWWRDRRAAWEHPEAVLYWRIRRLAPGQDVAAAWPAPRADWLAPETVARHAAAADARRQAAAALAQREAAQTAAAAARLAELERDLGPLLDGFTPAQQLALFAGDEVWAARYRANGAVGYIRSELLDRLALVQARLTGGAP